MKKSFRRVIASFSLVALIAVLFASPSNAADAPTGVGSAGGGVTLASLDYGDLLNAALLGEANSATIDPGSGVPTATETLSPLNVHSVTLPLLDNATVPSVQTTSTGAADQKTTDLVDLSTLSVPGLTGAINPATLNSQVDSAGALASLTSTLANLHLLGVLGVDSANLDLSGLAGPTSSNASRGATVNAITLLDLQGLLNLVGLTVDQLPISDLLAVLGQLGEIDTVNTILGNTTFSNPTDIQNDIDTLNAAIDSAQTTLTSDLAALALQQTALTACAGLQSCIDLVQPLFNAAQAAVTAAQTVVDTVQAQLTGLLQTVADVLTQTPIVSIEGVNAGAVAHAADTVANSAATVTAAVGHIKVGGIDLGAIDANTTLDQVTALTDSVVSTLNTALTTISPSLADLLSVKLFDRSTSVAQAGDYVQALASITALTATITPPDICAVLDDVFSKVGPYLPQGVTLPTSAVTDALTQLGSGLPFCNQVVALNASGVRAAALPQGSFAALTGPVTFKAASVSSAAEFKAVAATPELPATPESPSLPRTGMNETLLLVIGGLMAAAALGLRRAAAPVKVRSRRR